MSNERKPHLRAVPIDADEQRVVGHHEPEDPVEHQVEETAEVLGRAEQARDGGGAFAAQPAMVRPRPLGALGATSGTFGTLGDLGTHALATTGAAGAGALIGGVAAGSWRGAGLGAATNVAMLGLVSAVLGGGRLSTGTRIGYGVLGVASAGLVGFLLWRRWR